MERVGWEGIDRQRDNADKIKNYILQKQIEQKMGKQNNADDIKKTIIAAVMSGKMKRKPDADISNLGDMNLEGAGFGQTLGRLGGAFEPVKDKAKFSYSTARQALLDQAITPEEFYLSDRATGVPGTEKMILGKKRTGGFMGTGYGPGSEFLKEPEMIGPEKSQKPRFGKYELKPQAEALQNMARSVFTGEINGDNTEGTDEETKALIEEYQTTDDPVRLKEIEDALTQLGVNFQ